MNDILAALHGARALIDQALRAIEELRPPECEHPDESAEPLASNGLPEQRFRCGACREEFSRPWPEEEEK